MTGTHPTTTFEKYPVFLLEVVPDDEAADGGWQEAHSDGGREQLESVPQRLIQELNAPQARSSAITLAGFGV